MKNEMSLFEDTKKKPGSLEKLNHTLCTVKPTSVEPMRFSVMGLLVLKFRKTVNDEIMV